MTKGIVEDGEGRYPVERVPASKAIVIWRQVQWKHQHRENRVVQRVDRRLGTNSSSGGPPVRENGEAGGAAIETQRQTRRDDRLKSLFFPPFLPACRPSAMPLRGKRTYS